MSMTLEDIYEYLATGELAHVIMGSKLDNDKLEVPKQHYARLRNAIQLGLTDLHKRFLLREEQLVVDISQGPGTYWLTRKYAQSNTKSTEPVKYLVDSEQPFQENLLRIARVKDPEGNDIPMNLLDSEYTIRVLRNDQILVGKDITTTTLTIHYHADHPILNKFLADSSPMSVSVDLPTALLHPLTLFVASRVMNPIGLSEQFHEGNNYFSKYLAAVNDISQQGLDIRQTSENSRLEDNGWA